VVATVMAPGLVGKMSLKAGEPSEVAKALGFVIVICIRVGVSAPTSPSSKTLAMVRGTGPFTVRFTGVAAAPAAAFWWLVTPEAATGFVPTFVEVTRIETVQLEAAPMRTPETLNEVPPALAE